MFNKADILARLQAGESIQAIAEDITAILNEANGQYIQEQKAAEAARIAAEEAAKKAELQKKEELEVIINLTSNWLYKYMGGKDPATINISAEEIMSFLEECKKYFDLFDDKMDFLMGAIPTVKKSAAAGPKVVSKGVDETIDEWLNKMGW